MSKSREPKERRGWEWSGNAINKTINMLTADNPPALGQMDKRLAALSANGGPFIN